MARSGGRGTSSPHRWRCVMEKEPHAQEHGRPGIDVGAGGRLPGEDADR
ncbi:hypothetical protein ACFXKR_09340 [Streptomyces violascens]